MKITNFILLLSLLLSLPACNTLSGIGRDLKGLGGALEDWGGR